MARIRGLLGGTRIEATNDRAGARLADGVRSGKGQIRNRLVVLAITFAGSLLFSAAGDQKRVTIYSNAANYSLPLLERNGQDYVGLLEAIEPLGNVSAVPSGSHWRLRYENVEVDFVEGASQVRIRNANFDLRSSFLLENGRGLVPVATLGPLLSRILGGPVTSHDASRRLFIGSAAIHFTAQLTKENPPRLVMNFTAPVNPMIATEPGKLSMLFTRDALMPPSSPSLMFDNPVIPSANYVEDNGEAQITINATAPLFASFSNGNRTITISSPSSSQPSAQAPSATAAPQPNTAPGSSNAAAGSAGSAPHPAAFFAVVDASHGGSERGEAITDRMAEKDVTLAFARSLRQALQARGLSTLIVRDGDVTLTADQRASLSNTSHPAIYICLHASSQGRGVRLYTALLPASGESSGPFVDWATAQSAFLPLSQAVAASVAEQLEKRQVATRVLIAPLRPLNNIAGAAMAVEVAPPPGGAADLNSPTYQDMVAGSVATGVLSMRDRLEAGR